MLRVPRHLVWGLRSELIGKGDERLDPIASVGKERKVIEVVLEFRREHQNVASQYQ
jgi:hypothetical protein